MSHNNIVKCAILFIFPMLVENLKLNPKFLQANENFNPTTLKSTTASTDLETVSGIDFGSGTGINHGVNYGINNGINYGINHGVNNGINYGVNQGVNNGINKKNVTLFPQTTTKETQSTTHFTLECV